MGAIFGKLCPLREPPVQTLDFTQLHKQIKKCQAAVSKMSDLINRERKDILQGEAVHSKALLDLKVRFVSLYDQLQSEATTLAETAKKSDEMWKSQMPVVSKELEEVVKNHKNQALRVQSLCKESLLLLLETKRVRMLDEGLSLEEIAPIEEEIQALRRKIA